MPETRHINVKDLSLDLTNYRTVPQTSESKAIHAMVTLNPAAFWALTESLLEDGYHPTENIVVLAGKKKSDPRVVKEGNRRVAALKLTLGYVSVSGLDVPDHIKKSIKALSDEWKMDNAQVPCAIYPIDEADTVDRIIALTHGKGEKAGRAQWETVAKARHNREVNGVSEPGLDLLEAYLKSGKNLTPQQKERWAGDYPLSVLDETLKKWAVRLGATSVRELADQYPKKTSFRDQIEEILLAVGLAQITFPLLRGQGETLAATYGVPAAAPSGASASKGSPGPGSGGAVPPPASSPATPPPAIPPIIAAPATRAKIAAVSVSDPKSVSRALKAFKPKGKGRDKIVALLNEARTLKVDTHPHAFCFVLRSMFELSAKAYCDDHHPLTVKKSDGTDRALVDVLRDVAKHIENSQPTPAEQKAKGKVLHGAMSQLGLQHGLLSVTSMNQLVHNPKFSIDASHICSVFGNIFPLLEEMNS